MDYNYISSLVISKKEEINSIIFASNISADDEFKISQRIKGELVTKGIIGLLFLILASVRYC